MDPSSCPCGSGLPFTRCCGPYLEGHSLPTTAEALMRSRYTAFARLDEAYLLQTWHPSTRPHELGLKQQPPIKWLGLSIRHTQAGGEHDDTGSVEFVARYKVNGKAERLHEISRFVREAGRWFYLQGEVEAAR